MPRFGGFDRFTDSLSDLNTSGERLVAIFVQLDFVAFKIFNHGAEAEFGFGCLGEDRGSDLAELVERIR